MFLGGGDGKGSGCFPVGSFALASCGEHVEPSNSGWGSQGEGSAVRCVSQLFPSRGRAPGEEPVRGAASAAVL